MDCRAAFSAKRRDAFSICFGKRELREMQLRHDWTREEIRHIYNLPLPELIFQAQTRAPRISSARRSAALPLALDQDRRLPGGLRVLPAKRALRDGRSPPGLARSAGGAGSRHASESRKAPRASAWGPRGGRRRREGNSKAFSRWFAASRRSIWRFAARWEC